jgi:uncharacterized protein
LIDKQGTFISNTVLHILGEGAHEKAKTLFAEVTKQIAIDAIAVGNGTGGREAETFIRKVLKEIEKEIPVILVSESGASVYSASDVAREEFPDLDLTIRGAISIARRLQDPLAELVKVDPKSIGVGQYQHDVSQTALKKSLAEVVESCVNGVGVDLNTASAPLLSYVAGIGPALAKSIVDHRKTNGLFSDRDQLLKVTRFSPKVFEQSAGFLRVPQGKHPLDSTGVHPERYAAVRDMAAELSVPVTGLFGENAKKILALRSKWAQIIGEFTFDDIVRELEKPGRDPRDPFKVFAFRDDIFEVKDLKEGMICPGIVTNVTNFGAFVDIGVHQDGLVHISELSTKFVDDPRKVVNPGDQVMIRVLGVDLEKTQVSLSMILEAGAPRERAARGESTERAPRGEKAARAPRAPREPKTPPPTPTPGPRVGGPQVRDPNAPMPSAGGRPTPRGPGMIPAAGSGPRPGDSRNENRGGDRGFGGGPRPHMGNDRSGGGNRGGGFGGGSPFNNPFAALLNNDSKNSKNK